MRFQTLILLAAVFGCSAGDSGVSFTVTGKVLSAYGDTTGIAGVKVVCPLCQTSTTTGPDGTFTFIASAPYLPTGEPPKVAIWFESNGFASVPKSLRPVEGVEYTIVAIMKEKTNSESITMPTGTLTVTVPSKLGIFPLVKFTLFEASLFDEHGSQVTGEVETLSANWDPINPERTLSIPPVASGSKEYLLPVAIGQFAAYQNEKRLSINRARGVGLTMTTSLPPDPQISDTDKRLFYVDYETGALIEKEAAELNTAMRTLKATMDSDGTWLWARSVGDTACVMVEVKGPEGEVEVGAQVTLFEKSVSGEDIRLLDERVGAVSGTYCLRGPTGRLGRVRVWLARGANLLSEDHAVSLISSGSCETTCQASVTLQLSCTSEMDCLDGRVCKDGLCVKPTKRPPE